MEYKYIAFVSYSHEDKKIAKYVQSQLETFHLPTKLANIYPEFKRGIRPIFRDETDLNSGNLSDSLNANLQHSKYLIVICSPSSAKSV